MDAWCKQLEKDLQEKDDKLTQAEDEIIKLSKRCADLMSKDLR